MVKDRMRVFWTCWFQLQLEVQQEKTKGQLDIGYVALELSGDE